VAQAPYEVRELSAAEIPWLARARLRRIRRQRKTGVLLYGLIRTPARSASTWSPVVSVREDGKRLCICGSARKFPKFASLSPGAHKLTFLAATLRERSTFDRTFELAGGDVIVAIGDPIETKWAWEQRQAANIWYVGIVSSSDPQ
jgi:hypothetical protein